MSDIKHRLRASVRMDAVHGDTHERSVCARQMVEAANEIERLTAERDELRGLIDAHNADCIAACKYKRENGNCLTYTEGGHVCVTCPRDEMIAQADAAMGGGNE